MKEIVFIDDSRILVSVQEGEEVRVSNIDLRAEYTATQDAHRRLWEALWSAGAALVLVGYLVGLYGAARWLAGVIRK